MARHRFDELTKYVGHARSRRTFLQALLGLLLGPILGRQAAHASDRLCHRNGRPCVAHRQCCSGFCDGRVVCRPGKQPRNNKKHKRNKKNKPNRKRERCRGAERDCDGRCVNVRSHRRHCGRCGTACAPFERCRAGVCVCDVCPEGCAFDGVQDAVEAASQGDTIYICPGAYTGAVVVDKNLSLIGAGAATTSLTAPEWTLPILVIHIGATVQVRALTVTGPENGGILNLGTLTLIDCVVADNRDYSGGGIENSGTLTLRRTAVRDNTADSLGGGIYNFGGGRLSIEAGSSVTGNAAAVGGGVLNDSNMTVAPSVIFANNVPDNCDGVGPGTDTCPP